MATASAVIDEELKAAGAKRSGAPAPRVWAVGGGKGGVGKSVVTANLAISMAKRGRRCVVVDVDLGGANLHTVLGMPNPHKTLGHFLSGKEAKLSDVLCESPVPGLWLASGSSGQLEIANLKHFQKQKLLRHLRGLDTDEVILDLGAGSSFNVLDFYLAAQRGILVVTPEPTSIENAYHFLKAAFYRWLGKIAKESAVRGPLQEVLGQRSKRDMRSPRDLIAAVLQADRAAGQRLLERVGRFSPMLIVNQIRKAEHRKLGREISDACQGYLGTGVDFLGALDWDSCVSEALSHGQPVLNVAPSCAFSQEIEAIAERLIEECQPSSAEAKSCSTQDSRSERVAYDPSSLAMYGLLGDDERRARFQNRRVSSAPNQAAPKATPPTPSVEPDPNTPMNSGVDLPPLDVSRPGAYLQRCRERLGIRIPDLAERTRIRGAHFESIEKELFHRLPPEPYVRGFILQYARMLGISDAAALAESFSVRYREALPSH